MRIHTGKTSHYCKICAKHFNNSKSLKQHRLLHERKNQTNSNPNPSIGQTVETPAKTETPVEFTNNQATTTQMPSLEAPAVQWPNDQNGAFQMPAVEPSFESTPTPNVNSDSFNPIARTQTFDDVSKLFFKGN